MLIGFLRVTLHVARGITPLPMPDRSTPGRVVCANRKRLSLRMKKQERLLLRK